MRWRGPRSNAWGVFPGTQQTRPQESSSSSCLLFCTSPATLSPESVARVPWRRARYHARTTVRSTFVRGQTRPAAWRALANTAQAQRARESVAAGVRAGGPCVRPGWRASGTPGGMLAATSRRSVRSLSAVLHSAGTARGLGPCPRPLRPSALHRCAPWSWYYRIPWQNAADWTRLRQDETAMTRN